MTQINFICGKQGTGKTAIIRAILRLAKAHHKYFAGFKPFDEGLLNYNSRDILSDGEEIALEMKDRPNVNLISPYIANEDYPFEMSFRRDGGSINEKLLESRLKTLITKYGKTFIEMPQGLFTPLTEDKTNLDWIKEVFTKRPSNTTAEIIWVVQPEKKDFEYNLSQLAHLKNSGIPFKILLNNSNASTDQDFLFYLWEKLEDFTGQEILGMIPYTEETNDIFDDFVDRFEENLSAYLEPFFEPSSEETEN